MYLLHYSVEFLVWSFSITLRNKKPNKLPCWAFRGFKAENWSFMMTALSCLYIAQLNISYGYLLSPWEKQSLINCLVGRFEGFETENWLFMITQLSFYYKTLSDILFGHFLSPWGIWSRINCLFGRFGGHTVWLIPIFFEKKLVFTPLSRPKGSSQCRISIKRDWYFSSEPLEGRQSRPNFYETNLLIPLPTEKRQSGPDFHETTLVFSPHPPEGRLLRLNFY